LQGEAAEAISLPLLFFLICSHIEAPNRRYAMIKALIDNRSLQSAMKAAGYYAGAIDGDFGKNSIGARNAWLSKAVKTPWGNWSEERRQVALNQVVMKAAGIQVGDIDGLIGPQTIFSIEQWQNRSRDLTPEQVEIKHQPTVFPRYDDMTKFYGKPGTGLIMMTIPYPVRIAWEKTKSISKFQIHKLCAQSAQAAMEQALAHYGLDEIQRLGLDLWGGCVSDRVMRGGTRLSTHAWGAAIDWDPERNQLRWGADRSVMDNADRAPFLDAWQARGWISLGRERNFDWMHVQACRL
jgi:hypothetical protein